MEQIYKVYVIGDQFDYMIKTSIPEKISYESELLFFETADKFEPEQFSKYS